jgi:hypothetical protein
VGTKLAFGELPDAVTKHALIGGEVEVHRERQSAVGCRQSGLF